MAAVSSACEAKDLPFRAFKSQDDGQLTASLRQ